MQAYRRNGLLVIEVSEDALVDGAVQIPDNPVRVTDRERFLNWIASQVTTFGDDGDFSSMSELGRLFDKLATEAAECDAGCEAG